MKIGRNDPCPCGSGKKYKKCCLNVSKEVLTNPFLYHEHFIHNKVVKAPVINQMLLNIHDNQDELDVKDVVSDYLKAMNYIFDYADKNNIHTLKEIDEADLIGDFINNVIGDFEDVILNLDKKDYDLNLINDYIDKLIRTFDLDDDIYEDCLRCKTHNLFKMGQYETGEKVMLDLINEKGNSIYPYVELVDDFEMAMDLEKAKYYYDLGLKQKDLKDMDVLEEREFYFK